jgi:hypothetical protein
MAETKPTKIVKVASPEQVAKIVKALRSHPSTKVWAAQYTDVQVARVFVFGFKPGWATVTSAQAAVARVQWILRDNVQVDPTKPVKRTAKKA